MKYACGRLEIFAKLWLDNLKEKDYLRDLDVDGRYIYIYIYIYMNYHFKEHEVGIA
jgi:hypothetical protein